MEWPACGTPDYKCPVCAAGFFSEQCWLSPSLSLSVNASCWIKAYWGRGGGAEQQKYGVFSVESKQCIDLWRLSFLMHAAKMKQKKHGGQSQAKVLKPRHFLLKQTAVKHIEVIIDRDDYLSFPLLPSRGTHKCLCSSLRIRHLF